MRAHAWVMCGVALGLLGCVEVAPDDGACVGEACGEVEVRVELPRDSPEERRRRECQRDLCLCGNGICEPSVGETDRSCFMDCSCGNGRCEEGFGESVSLCPEDCRCGDGTCGADEDHAGCPEDCTCGDGACQFFLGEHRGTCPEDCGSCGDGVCDVGWETVRHCPEDCACGDGFCDDGEDHEACPDDCPEPECSTDVDCHYGWSCCEGRCLETYNDRSNCGGCDVQCIDNMLCIAGECCT